MANLIDKAKQQIDDIINNAYTAAYKKGSLPEGGKLQGVVEIPRDSGNGDYAATHAMAGAKALKMAPR